MFLDTDKDRIRHMVEAVREAMEYAATHQRHDLDSDRPFFHLVLGNLTILGEAASRVSLKQRTSRSDIPWRDMVDMRNKIIHAYYDLNRDIIWSTVQTALPPLLTQLEALLEELERDSEA